MGIVYTELRRLARRQLRREQGCELQTTGLVHEAYLRLTHTQGMDWQGRAHFFAMAANVMRRILVDLARARRSLKRGGAIQRLEIDTDEVPQPERVVDLLALDSALERLARLNERHSRVVELRYFGGLDERAVALVLDVSTRTVQQDWRLARSWLQRELSEDGHES